jgi:arylsulfatase A-like enzyme
VKPHKRLQSRVLSNLFCSIFLWCLLSLLLSCAKRAPAPTFYRFDDHLNDTTSIQAPIPEKVDALVSFEFDDPERTAWKTRKKSSVCEVREGVLIIETLGRDRVSSPAALQIDTNEAALIRFRMKVEGVNNLRLRWMPRRAGGFTPRTKLRIPVAKVGEWCTYDIQTLGLHDWSFITRPVYRRGPNQFIDRMLLEVPRKARIELDYVRVLSEQSLFAARGAGAEVVPYKIGDVLRTCLYTFCPAELRYRVVIPENARISTGLAILDPTTPITFAIIVEEKGSSETLLDTRVVSGDQWHDVTADIGHYAGRQVDVILKADCAETGKVALWSNPTLHQTRVPEIKLTSPTSQSPDLDQNVSVVLYLIDALRPDHLEAYGYERETAPTTKALAEEGVRFARCFAPSTWTRPSVSSLFAGVPVVVHGVEHIGNTMSKRLTTLAEVARRHDYTTAAFVENPHPTAIAGLARGFGHHDASCAPWGEEHERVLQGKSDQWASAVAPALEWLKAHKDRRFFMYVHTVEPHAPYAPKEPYASLHTAPGSKPSKIDLYDAEISHADANLDRFISGLKDLGVWEETFFILIADHGQAFLEHEGMTTHGGKPYNELIHIPLIMRCPALVSIGKVISENVQIIDIAPTILDVLGILCPEHFQGISLLPLARGGDVSAFRDRPILSQGSEVTSLIRGEWKILYGEGTEKLYNLATDFGETKDLAGENPSQLKLLLSEAREYIQSQIALAKELVGREEEGEVKIDARTIEQLKALGYLK